MNLGVLTALLVIAVLCVVTGFLAGLIYACHHEEQCAKKGIMLIGDDVYILKKMD